MIVYSSFTHHLESVTCHLQRALSHLRSLIISMYTQHEVEIDCKTKNIKLNCTLVNLLNLRLINTYEFFNFVSYTLRDIIFVTKTYRAEEILAPC